MKDTEEIPFRPLGIIKDFLEKHGFTVAYCHEDLIFMEHNAFLLRMEEKGEDLSLIFNVDCEKKAADGIALTLLSGCGEFGLKLALAGQYRLTPDEENQTIDIAFID